MSALFCDLRLPNRFWSKVRVEPNGCWRWTATYDPAKGYGFVWHEGKMRRAHRVAYLVLIGPITEQTLDHLCRNTACVNPAHLEPTSNKTNILRGNSQSALNAKKTHCPRGHLYGGADTYISKRGTRNCNACRRGRRAEAAIQDAAGRCK